MAPVRRPSEVPFVLAALAVLLAGCTGGQGGAAAARRPAPGPVSGTGGPTDPLATLTDQRSSDFLADRLDPVVHARGRGPAHLTVLPAPGTGSVRFYVVCSPDSHFTVTMCGFFSGPCGRQFENSGQIPLPATAASVTVDLDLPQDVDYWLVGLRVG